MQELIIRQETPADYAIVAGVIQKAFENEKYSDQSEHYLVERLRRSSAFVPELSLVAELNKRIVGHILLTKITLRDAGGKFVGLALAPVSVLPEFQRQGIGGKLIQCAHAEAKKMRFDFIAVLGHAGYYPRFGYEKAEKFGMKFPFDVSAENCFIFKLTENALTGAAGIIEYAKEFFE